MYRPTKAVDISNNIQNYATHKSLIKVPETNIPHQWPAVYFDFCFKHNKDTFHTIKGLV